MGKWNYKSFYIDFANINEEKKMMCEFMSFVDNKKKELDPNGEYPKRLFH